jgi:hypothetical protein
MVYPLYTKKVRLPFHPLHKNPPSPSQKTPDTTPQTNQDTSYAAPGTCYREQPPPYDALTITSITLDYCHLHHFQNKKEIPASKTMHTTHAS